MFTLSATTDLEARDRIVFHEAPKPQGACMACEPTGKGYRIYFKSHSRTAVEGEEILVVRPSKSSGLSLSTGRFGRKRYQIALRKRREMSVMKARGCRMKCFGNYKVDWNDV
jgi:hypothetical protein